MKASMTDEQILNWLRAIRQVIYNRDPGQNDYCRVELFKSYANVCAIGNQRGVLDSVDTKPSALIVGA